MPNRGLRARKRKATAPVGKLKFLLRALVRRIIFSGRLYRYRWPDQITVNSPAPENIVFTQITYENIGLVREWKGSLVEKRFRDLLKRNHLGLYALSDDKVVGFFWVAINRGSKFTCFQHELLDPAEAICARFEMRPEYWRIRIALHLHAELLELVRRVDGKGVTRIWGDTRTDNKIMQHVARKLNCVREREHHIIVFLGMLFIYRIWDLTPNTEQRSGREHFVVRWRIPDFLYRSWPNGNDGDTGPRGWGP